VVIHDLDLVRVPVAPLEAHSPTIVDANAVLAGTISHQLLEPIPGRDAEIGKRPRSMQDPELPGGQGNRMKLCWADSGPERTK